MPENLTEEEKEAWEKCLTVGARPTATAPPPSAMAPPPSAAPASGARVPPAPARDPEQTLHLERSEMEAAAASAAVPAASALPAPPDAAVRYERTMVMGTFPAQ